MQAFFKFATALAAVASFTGAGTAWAQPAVRAPVASLEPAKTQARWQHLVAHRRAARATADCRPLRAVFYAGTDWLRLATKLAGAPSPCAQYYVSIPPQVSDKTQPRADQAWRIRALGSAFHALAEINVTGWTTWVANNGGSWYAAGVEARRRMAAAGYDVSRGDSWALNELSSAVRRGDGNARANMRALIRGLYDAGGLRPPTRGTVFVSGMSQATGELSVYQARLQDWLEDGPFWADMSAYVADWSQELYGDFRNYGVFGAPLAQRRDSLNDYLQHELFLANGGPETTVSARSFLQTAYSPLANAAWEWDSAFGWTAIDFGRMQGYVSSQTYALRHASAQAAQDHAGFAWSPKNLAGLSSSDFTSQTSALLDRLAAAIRDSAAAVDPADPGVGACGPLGSNLWCTGDVDGAWFNDGWKAFAAWRPSLLAFTTPPLSLTAGTASSPLAVQLQTYTGVSLPPTSPLTLTLASSSAKGRFATSSAGPWSTTLSLTIAPNATSSPSFYYRDTLAGSAVLTVSAPGKQSGTQTETVSPGPLAALKVAPSSATLAAGTKKTFSVTGRDAYGNSVPLAAAIWAVSVGTPGSVSPANGLSTVFTASTTPGSGSVVATSGALTASASVTVAPTAVVSSISYVRQGADLLVTLAVTDAAGKPIAGASTTFSIARSGVAYTSASATTGGDGRATATLFGAPAGCYTTTVTGVTATGYVWDKKTPANQICL